MSIEDGQPAQKEAAGLFDGFEAYRTPSDEEIREAIRQSLVVLDTNVLLNLYRYNEQTRESIFEILVALGDRLFVPRQVLEEFWRNRERALSDPVGQVRVSVAELAKSRDAAIEQLRVWVNRGALTTESSEGVEKGIIESVEQATMLVQSLLDESILQRSRNTNLDTVLSQLEIALAGRVGAPMPDDAYALAVNEGNRRADAGEPPGFADAKKVGRDSEGASGDYLVWEQMLVEASERGALTVVFVTGDVKRDWWRYEGNSPRGPRVELAREMHLRSGSRLLMLRPETLLEYADELAVAVRPETVEDVERTSRETAEPSTRPASESPLEVTGWTREAVQTMLRQLAVQAPVQEACIRLAADAGGFISRDDVYVVGDYEPERQLKGFTRPVNRIVQALRDAGDLPDEAADALVPVYDQGVYGFGWADGFRVPAEIVLLLTS